MVGLRAALQLGREAVFIHPVSANILTVLYWPLVRFFLEKYLARKLGKAVG
jgi:hypothetical protein